MEANDKSRITIAFDPDWISEKKKAGVRVIRLLEAAVRGDERVRVAKSSRTDLTFETDAAHRTDMLRMLAP